MDIQGYIVDHWIGKTSSKHPIITIYDPDRRYQGLLPYVSERGVTVIDTTVTPLRAREAAMTFWTGKMQADEDARMLIYRGVEAPVNREAKQCDPYINMSQVGVEFPIGPKDEYINLCKSFLPKKEDVIEQMFARGTVSFDNINSLQEGAQYPELERITGGQSFEEIIVNLLALQTTDSLTWLNEWRVFGSNHLPGLDCNSTTLDGVKKKLWQYLLFSEFVLDLPEALPLELTSVSISPRENELNINNLCRNIRNRQDLRDEYVDQANAISKLLNLDKLFAHSRDLGKIVTFGFENRVEYDTYLELLGRGDYTRATELLQKNKKSVWYHADRAVETFWNLAESYESMLDCIRRSASVERTNLKAIVDWYTKTGYKVDLAFRKFQTLYNQSDVDTDAITELARLLHIDYRSFTEQMQQQYVNAVKAEGYPAIPIEKNLGAWDRHILPLLKRHKRVVLIMADAFRYEMGCALNSKLDNRYTSTCTASAAYLPTVTRFGMAALLPEAESKLVLKNIDGEVQPTFDGEVVSTPDQRIAWIQAHVPVGVNVMDTTSISAITIPIPTDVNMLVVRSTKIDTAGEQVQGVGLNEMQNELTNFAKIANYCKQSGFESLFIMADHGFMIQPSFLPGDNMAKPNGTIVLKERRCVGGDVSGSESTVTFEPAELGCKCDLNRIAYPKQFGVFESGKIYFHEGLSLQENIVPIIEVTLSGRQERHDSVIVNIRYKNQATGIVRTLRPVIQLSVQAEGSLFQPESTIMRLEIKNASGRIVGHPGDSSYYDETNDILKISGDVETARQTIELDEDVSGDITITALDPDTNVTFASITLQTDINNL